jgi:thiol-disulfide isomerase/thioredoxin
MKRRALWFAILTSAILASALAAEKDLLPANADEAWKEVENAAKAPSYPEDWNGKAPTEEQKEAFQKMLGVKSIAAAEKAREFHVRFPDHPKAGDARERERQFVQQALNFGATELPRHLESTLSEEERIAQKLNLVNRRAIALQSQGMAVVIKEFENGLREIMREFPRNSSLASQLLIVAQNTDDKEHAKKVLDELMASDFTDEGTKGRAKGMLRSYEAIGRPLRIAFTATDGSAIDLQKMEGKVVLLDFWASWCGPCIASLPEIIKLYENYHAQGLEIIGINMDKERSAMDSAIEKFEIPWRHYFDGRGWGNRYAMEYNVSGIPSMWLVDKRGILRTMEAREDLENQVKALLAEPNKL